MINLINKISINSIVKNKNIIFQIPLFVVLVVFLSGCTIKKDTTSYNNLFKNDSVIISAKVYKYANLPHEFQKDVDESADYFDEFNICNKWSSANADRNCEKIKKENLYYPYIEVSNKKISKWTNMFSCGGASYIRKCNENDLQQKIEKNLQESPKWMYGKYRNNWRIKVEGNEIESRSKSDGHKIIMIYRDGDVDKILFYPIEKNPSDIGIQLYHSLTPNDEVIQTIFYKTN